jgi:hypothetical protein
MDCEPNINIPHLVLWQMLTAERNAREHPRQRPSTQRLDPLVLPPAQGFPPKNIRKDTT